MATRQKNTGTYQKYSNDQLQSAIGLVRAGEATQRAAAKRYGIPQSTISDHMRGRTKPGVDLILMELIVFQLLVFMFTCLSVFFISVGFHLYN